MLSVGEQMFGSPIADFGNSSPRLSTLWKCRHEHVGHALVCIELHCLIRLIECLQKTDQVAEEDLL